MEDVFGCLAQRLARCPLWRVDLSAMGRLVSVCRAARGGASQALEGLRVREQARRKRVACARRVLALAGPFLKGGAVMVEQYRESLRFLIRVDVTFNGRIRVRESDGCGRYTMACITPHQEPEDAPVLGRLLILYHGRVWSLAGATFTDLEGLLGALRHITLLGRERWKQTHPREWEAWKRYMNEPPNMVHHWGARVFH